MIANTETFLKAIINRVLREEWTPVQVWEIRLYVNDVTPTCATVPGDFTEATFGGYAPKDILPENWTEPTVEDCVATSFYGSSPLSWTCSADPEDVYGYWIHDVVANRVVWAERLESPAELSVGGVFLVQPRYRQGDFVVCP